MIKNYIIEIENKKYLNILYMLKNIKEIETKEEYIKFEKTLRNNLKKHIEVLEINKNSTLYEEINKNFLEEFISISRKTNKRIYYFVELNKENISNIFCIIRNNSFKYNMKTRDDNGKIIPSLKNTKQLKIKKELERIYSTCENIYSYLGEDISAKECIPMGKDGAKILTRKINLLKPIFMNIVEGGKQDIYISLKRLPLVYKSSTIENSFYRFATVNLLKDDIDLERYNIKTYEIINRNIDKWIKKMGYRYNNTVQELLKVKNKKNLFELEKEIVRFVKIELMVRTAYQNKKKDLISYLEYKLGKASNTEKILDESEDFIYHIKTIDEFLNSNNEPNRYGYTNLILKNKYFLDMVLETLENTTTVEYTYKFFNKSNIKKDILNNYKNNNKNHIIDLVDKYFSLIEINLHLERNRVKYGYYLDFRYIKDSKERGTLKTENKVYRDLYRQNKKELSNIENMIDDFELSIIKESKSYFKNNKIDNFYA